MGDRTDKTLKKLIDRIDTGSCTFVTDDWDGFYRVIPEERHVTGKDLTFSIEQTNSDIRHRLARFHRRSKVTSRCKDMIRVSLNLFEHFQNANNFKAITLNALTLFG